MWRITHKQSFRAGLSSRTEKDLAVGSLSPYSSSEEISLSSMPATSVTPSNTDESNSSQSLSEIAVAADDINNPMSDMQNPKLIEEETVDPGEDYEEAVSRSDADFILLDRPGEM